MSVATRRHVYDDDTKAEAIALAREVGKVEAGRRLGISAGTIGAWMSRTGVATQAAGNLDAANAVKRAQWEERRTALVHEIGATAEQALRKAKGALTAGKATDAKNYATTMAILVDKAQLLSGGSTARYGTDTERSRVLAEAHERALHLVEREHHAA